MQFNLHFKAGEFERYRFSLRLLKQTKKREQDSITILAPCTENSNYGYFYFNLNVDTIFLSCSACADSSSEFVASCIEELAFCCVTSLSD